MTVSVVIPVYNVKPYLRRCIESVLCQDYNDIEIILVDDGSTDGSGELCDELSSQSACIKVVHQENQGLSGARNTGIRTATGEYIVFLDSDDEWLLSNGLSQLLKQGDATEDLIIFKCVDIWKNARKERQADYDIETINGFHDAQAVFNYLVRIQQIRMSACFLIVRRQLLLEHNIFFPLGYISEDVYWSLHLWQHAQNAVASNLDFYGYYHRDASISASASLRVYESYDKIFNEWKARCEQGCTNNSSIRIYMANLWVNRGYNYHKLKAKDKPEALTILKRHTDILEHANSPKAKRTALLVNLFGVRTAVNILGIYWKLRTWYKKDAV